MAYTEFTIEKEYPKRIIANSNKDIYLYMKSLIKERQEQIFVLTQFKKIILNVHTISTGSANYVTIHPRDVFYHAIMDNATSLIICHNHPHGNLEPSHSDIQLLLRFAKLGILFDIPISTFMIISEFGFSITRPDKKELDEFKEELL
jgi:DNA repair protein RadC